MCIRDGKEFKELISFDCCWLCQSKIGRLSVGVEEGGGFEVEGLVAARMPGARIGELTVSILTGARGVAWGGRGEWPCHD